MEVIIIGGLICLYLLLLAAIIYLKPSPAENKNKAVEVKDNELNSCYDKMKYYQQQFEIEKTKYEYYRTKMIQAEKEYFKYLEKVTPANVHISPSTHFDDIR